AVSRPLEAGAFDLVLGGLGTFPLHGRPRVLWLGAREGEAALANVHLEIGRRLEALGLAIETRPFTAHVTLARFKEPAAAAIRTTVQRGEASRIGSGRVRQVTLYHSRLGPGGATHSALAFGALSGNERTT